MSVAPFCNLPPLAKRMVVISDRYLDFSNTIVGKCDDVMEKVMSKLKIDIGKFEYRQAFVVGSFENSLVVKGGKSNEPCTCIEEVYLLKNEKKERIDKGRSDWEYSGALGGEVELIIEFKEEYQVDNMIVKYVPQMPQFEQRFEFVKTVQYS
jgi:hypothetical protein